MVQGREDAFSEVYSRYGSSVYGLARRFGRPKSAEEVTHDVFLALWHKPDSFDPDRGSLRSHLLAVAHRRAVDRSRGVTNKRGDEAEGTSRHHDRDSYALAEYANESIRTLLADLSDPQSHAIILAYFGGYTYRQVADRLHQPEEVVKTNIRFALAGLRKGVQPVEPYMTPGA
jgi:RNA polymerase sigma-70 factor (ECF subfamily)